MFWHLLLLTETALFLDFADAALSVCNVQASFLETARVQRLLATPNHPSAATLTDAFKQPAALLTAALKQRAEYLQSALTAVLDRDQTRATADTLSSLRELIAKLDKLEQKNVTDEQTSIETATEEGFDQQAGVSFLYIGDEDLEDGGETPEADITPIN